MTDPEIAEAIHGARRAALWLSHRAGFTDLADDTSACLLAILRLLDADPLPSNDGAPGTPRFAQRRKDAA